MKPAMNMLAIDAENLVKSQGLETVVDLGS